MVASRRDGSTSHGNHGWLFECFHLFSLFLNISVPCPRMMSIQCLAAIYHGVHISRNIAQTNSQNCNMCLLTCVLHKHEYVSLITKEIASEILTPNQYCPLVAGLNRCEFNISFNVLCCDVMRFQTYRLQLQCRRLSQTKKLGESGSKLSHHSSPWRSSETSGCLRPTRTVHSHRNENLRSKLERPRVYRYIKPIHFCTWTCFKDLHITTPEEQAITKILATLRKLPTAIP
jgi:hypothetical protein